MQWPKCQKLYVCLNLEMVYQNENPRLQESIRHNSYIAASKKAIYHCGSEQTEKVIAHHFTLDIQDSGLQRQLQIGQNSQERQLKKVKPGEVVAEGLGILGELHCVSRPMGPDQVEFFRNQIRSWF